METDDFYSQNSVSDVIVAHLKMMMMSFKKYYHEHEEPGDGLDTTEKRKILPLPGTEPRPSSP